MYHRYKFTTFSPSRLKKIPSYYSTLIVSVSIRLLCYSGRSTQSFFPWSHFYNLTGIGNIGRNAV